MSIIDSVSDALVREQEEKWAKSRSIERTRDEAGDAERWTGSRRIERVRDTGDLRRAYERDIAPLVEVAQRAIAPVRRLNQRGREAMLESGRFAEFNGRVVPLGRSPYPVVQGRGAGPSLGGIARGTLSYARRGFNAAVNTPTLGPGLTYRSASERAQATQDIVRAPIPDRVRDPIVEAMATQLRYGGLGGAFRGSSEGEAQFVAEAAVPREAWEVAIEFVPGIGTIPDLQRAVRNGVPEAQRALRQAMDDPRVVRALRAAASEEGMVQPDFFARWREDSAEALKAYDSTLKARGLDPADRKALKFDRLTEIERQRLVNSLEQWAPLNGGENTVRQILEGSLTDIDDELAFRAMSPGERALMRRRLSGQRGRTPFTGRGSFKGIPSDELLARRRAAEELLDDLPLNVEEGGFASLEDARMAGDGSPQATPQEAADRQGPVPGRTAGTPEEAARAAGSEAAPAEVTQFPTVRGPEPVAPSPAALPEGEPPVAGEPPRIAPPPETPVSRPQEPRGRAEGVGGGGGGGAPPAGTGGRPPDDGPVPPDDRRRISQIIAGGIERQGPEFVQQEAIRSQERSQRAARVRQIRRDPSLTSAERKTAIRQALAGEYRKGEFAPLEISDADFGLAERMIRDSDLREFEYVSALVGLSRLRSGQHVRKFEQRLAGQVFGPEVLAAIRRREKSLASRIAETWGVSAEDVARAAREEELARPTTRGTRPSTLDTPEERGMRNLSNLTREAREAAIKRSIRRQAQQEARAAREMNEEIARSTRQMVRETDRYLRTTPEGLEQRAKAYLTDRLGNLRKVKNPNPEQRAEIARLERDIDSGMDATVGEIVRYWSQGNRAIIDGVGETQGAGRLARIIETAFTGEVTDSYVAALASRQTFLEMALIQSGLDPKDAARIGQFMFDREIAARYGKNIPEGVQGSIDMLKGLQLHGSSAGTLLEGLANFSEEMKSLMFGPDLGVFGIQLRASAQGGLIPGVAGAINRALTKMHHPLYGELYLETTLDRRIANILDGLYYGRGRGSPQGPEALPRRAGEGIVMSIPGYGQAVEKLTDWQFGTVLGGLRDTLYEGNLLLLHVLRRDIKNPATRAKAAEWANLLTGFGKGAQTAKRKTIERASVISPAMTRAQFGELRAASKLLTGDSDDRILAALAIASYGVTWLAVGKLINDVIGVRDFDMDPTKPGAGTITAKVPGLGDTSIPFMANASLKRTFLQSLRAIAESDEEALTNAWLRYATAREATAGRLVTGLATGRGYTPEGRFTGDISRGDLFKSLLPVPPVVQSAIYEGVNPVRQGLETLGINNYPRSDFDRADELIREYNGDFRAAMLAAGESGAADIVKYRWRQDIRPGIEALGFTVTPGTPERGPRLEFTRVQREMIDHPDWRKAFEDELAVDIAGAKTLSDIRRRYIDEKAQPYAAAWNLSLDEARNELGRYFDQSAVVAGTPLAYARDGSVSRRAKDGFEDVREANRIYTWQQNPGLFWQAVAVGWETDSAPEREAIPREPAPVR